MAQPELPSYVEQLSTTGIARVHFHGLLLIQGKGVPTCKFLTSQQVGAGLPCLASVGKDAFSPDGTWVCQGGMVPGGGEE